jgi:hypothetical protein
MQPCQMPSDNLLAIKIYDIAMQGHYDGHYVGYGRILDLINKCLKDTNKKAELKYASI